MFLARKQQEYIPSWKIEPFYYDKHIMSVFDEYIKGGNPSQREKATANGRW